jgi:hypothetical protein
MGHNGPQCTPLVPPSATKGHTGLIVGCLLGAFPSPSSPNPHPPSTALPTHPPRSSHAALAAL